VPLFDEAILIEELKASDEATSASSHKVSSDAARNDQPVFVTGVIDRDYMRVLDRRDGAESRAESDARNS
jgi:hypothetical protein